MNAVDKRDGDRGLLRELRLLMRVYRGDLAELGSLGERGGQPVAVVLGAQVRAGGVPSRTLAARAGHAGELYVRGCVGQSERMIVSGGVGEHPPSEAEVMARILAEYGVPEAEILREAASHSTRQSAHHVAILARRLGVDEVVVITDPLHCIRAVSAFQDEGLVSHPEPVTESPMWREPRERRAQFIREAGAIVWYRLWRPRR